MKPAIAILAAICLMATATTIARIGYDIHYKNVYLMSTNNYVVYAQPDTILTEVKAAERYGRWRPEMPFFEARAWIEHDRSSAGPDGSREAALNAMVRAKQLAPNAWWVKQLIGR